MSAKKSASAKKSDTKLNGKLLTIEQAAQYADLLAAYEAARAAERASRAGDDKDAVRAASAALSAFITAVAPPKRACFCSRAGAKQASMERALSRR